MLDLAAEKSGWAKAPPPGISRGIAYAEAFRTHIAHVVELSITRQGRVKIHRVICVADCGTTLDPGITTSSLEGGTVWGLGVAFKSAISFKNGRTVERNWHDYRIAQMDETPPIEVHMIESGARPLGGTGEVGPVTVVPAVVNALFAATGRRIRCSRSAWSWPSGFAFTIVHMYLIARSRQRLVWIGSAAIALIAVSAVATRAAAQANGQQPAQSDQARTFADSVSRPLVYHLPGESDVRVERDLSYRESPAAKADIYRPPDTLRRVAPIVVLIHGGVPPAAPRPKDWGIYQGWGRLLAAAGFVTVVFNHRLGYPDPHLDDAADDVEQLLKYVRSRAAELGADPDRVCLASYSAGGPLLSEYIRQPRPYVRCLAAFYSILDIRTSEIHGRYMNQEKLALFSPAAQLLENASKCPPLFVMRAGNDQIPGLNGWMEGFLDLAVKKNIPLTMMIHPTGAHGFENTNDDERSREILKTAIQFVKDHTQP